MTITPTILLAEDNPADVYLISEALRAQGLLAGLHVVPDGQEAIDFIERADEGGGHWPVVALLDLNLPKRSGLEVLARLRRSARFGDIPVAIISSSRSPKDVVESSRLHADRFFTKPCDYDEFMRLGAIVKEMLDTAALAAR